MKQLKTLDRKIGGFVFWAYIMPVAGIGYKTSRAVEPSGMFCLNLASRAIYLLYAVQRFLNLGSSMTLPQMNPRRTLSLLIERTAVRLVSDSAISAGSPV